MRKYMRMKDAGVKGVGAGECRQLVTGNRRTRPARPPLRLSPLAAADNLHQPHVGSIRTGPQPGGHDCSDEPAERTGAGLLAYIATIRTYCLAWT
jgi:hypothetical protein